MPFREWEQKLAALTAAGELCTVADGGVVHCHACAHRCAIAPGEAGRCRVRRHGAGGLRVPFGYVSGVACDPVEKKPFYHFLPGANVLSFGMLGCNFTCPFCQNWTTSQVLKDPRAWALPQPCSADEIVDMALRYGAPAVASTYNEPLITSEWAHAIFGKARQKGLRTCYISNGFATPEVLAYLGDRLDAINIDLKCFTDAGYSTLGGRLQPVLDTIRDAWERGIWVEIITLVVPEFNDSDDELSAIAAFIASVSPDIPWHVTAYHPDYQMHAGPDHTGLAALLRAAGHGRAAGLRYTYVGNVRQPSELENTRCHNCGAPLITRRGFAVKGCAIDRGRCSRCGAEIPGRWGTD